MHEIKLDEKILKLEQQVRSAYDHYQNLAEEHRLLKLKIDNAPKKIIAINKLLSLQEQKIKEALANSEPTQVKTLKQKKAHIKHKKTNLLMQRTEWETLLPDLGAKLISAKTKHAALAQELATARYILAQKTKDIRKSA